MIEWDVMPGGYLGVKANPGPLLNVENLLAVEQVFGFGLNINNALNNPPGTACISYELTSPINFISGMNQNLSSQALSFCFVPTMSAFDYQDNRNPDLDIFNEGVATIMTNNPFNVIIGEVNGLAGFPQQQVNAAWLPSTNPGKMSFPSLNRLHSSLINHLMPDTFMINDQNQTLFARYLNREIGDEEMFLDNTIMNRNAIFQAEYDMLAGINTNPLYEYVGQGTQEMVNVYAGGGNPFGYVLTNNGFFARSEPLLVQSGANVELRSENMPVNNGSIVQAGAGLQLTPIPQWVCTEEFVDLDGMFDKRDEVETNDDIFELKEYLYPNPVSSGESVSLNGFAKGSYTFRLFNLNGSLILPFNEIQIQEGETVIISIPQYLESGIYILEVNGLDFFTTYKISVL